MSIKVGLFGGIVLNKVVFLLVAAIASFYPTTMIADTLVSGAVTSSTTWTLANSPYLVTGTVTVNSGVGLTIEPGVTVKLNSGCGLVVNGTLTAVGAPSSRITFTSSSAAPGPGAWSAIVLQPSTTQAASEIAYADILYGGANGSYTYYGTVHVNSGTPTLRDIVVSHSSKSGVYGTGTATAVAISNSVLSNNADHGVRVANGATLTAEQNTIASNTNHAVAVGTNGRILSLTSTTVSGNGGGAKDAIGHLGGTIDGEEHWGHFGLPWDVYSANLYVAAGARLTIDSGVTVRFGAAKRLDVYGTLTAIGTEALPIAFTSNAAAPGRGAWYAVRLAGASTQPVSQIAWASFLWGGGSSNIGTGYYGGLEVSAGTPVISNVSVAESAKSGIAVLGGNPSITDTSAVSNSAHGLFVSGAAASTDVAGGSYASNGSCGVTLTAAGAATLTSVAITGNTSYAICADADTRLLGLTGTVSGNGGGAKDAIGHLGGTIDGEERWRNFGIPWDVYWAHLYVAAGARLTIDPGVTVRFGAAKQLSVYGTLTAIGTEVLPIAFTSNAALPNRGAWYAVRLAGATTQPVSQIAWASFLWGGGSPNIGTGYYGGLEVSAGTPVISQVSVAESAKSGIAVLGGNPSITDTSAASNSAHGLFVSGAAASTDVAGGSYASNGSCGVKLTAAGAATLTGVALTGNTSYAICADADTRLLGLTGTISGNGGGAKDAIGHLGGEIDGEEHWRNFGIPWDVYWAHLYVAAGARLTIDPGVTVRFGAAKQLTVYGALTAIGTEVLPIAFTSNAASPNRGAWYAVRLAGASTQPVSQIAWASFMWGGGSGNIGTGYYGGLEVSAGTPVISNLSVAESAKSGIAVLGGNPSISHATLTANAASGIRIDGSTTQASIVNCTFRANAAGLTNTSPANVILARYNHWDDPSGPSGSGPGTGQSVSTGVLFEPWLVSEPVSPNPFTTFTHINRTFNPVIDSTSVLDFGTVPDVTWQIEIKDPALEIVRSGNGSGPAATYEWNGRDDMAAILTSGRYRYEISATTPSYAATRIAGLFIVDQAKAIGVTGFTVVNPQFSPDGDGTKDTVTVSASTNYDGATWSFEVRDPQTILVRTISAAGGSVTIPWDGRNDAGALLPEGPYSLALTASTGTDSDTKIANAVLDTTVPTLTLTAPAAGDRLSNVLRNTPLDFAFPIHGSVGDSVGVASWTAEFGAGSDPSSWTIIASGSGPRTNAVLGTWATRSVTNGLHVVRLRATDPAGNSNSLTHAVYLENFTATQNAFHFNAAAGGTVSYTSVVPFPLDEAIQIRNSSGQVVRTLLAGSRAAGEYVDVWDGRDDAGNLLPDGAYAYRANLSGTFGAVPFDQSSEMRGTTWGSTHPTVRTVFDPFNNQNQQFSYTLTDAYRVVLQVVAIGQYTMNCQQLSYPSVCLHDNTYHAPGLYTYNWAGTAANGAFLLNRSRIGLHYRLDNFPRNVVVLHGTAPTLGDPFVSPPLYGPATGLQSVSFDLATFESAPVALRVRFLNQESLSVLRTLNLPSQAPGRPTVTWDGRADNGAWVAPGPYTVMIDVTDALGNTDTLHAVMTVAY